PAHSYRSLLLQRDSFIGALHKDSGDPERGRRLYTSPEKEFSQNKSPSCTSYEVEEQRFNTYVSDGVVFKAKQVYQGSGKKKS
ncbi:Glutamate receptor 2.4, partial [Bienertia sinuspersici]